AIMASNPYKAVEGANLLVLVTEWNEFKDLDYIKIKKLMKTPNIIDGRNFLDKKSLTEMGFTYRGIGI
ncbi:MAG: UDP-glucose 6-dehydrogenase, partial [Actinobacteria bacterium]|nr:UDP-glucose 6-dehydrogenase [Actinomycetota bacterium]